MERLLPHPAQPRNVFRVFSSLQQLLVGLDREDRGNRLPVSGDDFRLELCGFYVRNLSASRLRVNLSARFAELPRFLLHAGLQRVIF